MPALRAFSGVRARLGKRVRRSVSLTDHTAPMKIVKTALSDPNIASQLSKFGVMKGKAISFHDLEVVLKRDKAFAKMFYAKVGKVARDMYGIRIPLSDEKLGKIIGKTGIRQLKAVEKLHGSNASAIVAAEANKLIRLSEELAAKFSNGSLLGLVRKYMTSKSFREDVHRYIEARVSSDKSLAALRGLPASKVFAAAVSLRAATMGRLDMLRDASRDKSLAARAIAEFGKHAARTTAMAFSYSVMAISNMVLNLFLSQSATTAMYSVMDANKSASLAWREIGERLKMQEEWRKQMSSDAR